jgi:hypothetical protein
VPIFYELVQLVNWRRWRTDPAWAKKTG